MRAAGWTVLGHGLSQLIRLGSSLILTRLLAPELYGVMAVGYVVMTGIGMFSDIGLTANAIQSRRGDDPRFLNVSWVVQIVRGFILAAVALLVAQAIGGMAGAGWLPAHSVYADPQVPSLIMVISVYALVSGFDSTKAWYARRHLALAALTKIELATQLATTVFQLVWALIAPSIWTLAGGWIFGGILKMALTHAALSGPSNRIEWDRDLFREIMAFGKWTVLSSAFSFLLTSGDKLLLGALLDSGSMGSYSIAFLLIGALQVAILKVVGFAVLPALSEVYRSKPENMRATVYRIRRPLDIVCLVCAGAVLVLGPAVVEVLYDARYAAAGWMLAALSMVLVATRLDVFDQALIAMGRVKLLSLLNGIRLVALYTVVPIGYRLHGVRGAVYAVAACALINAAVVLTMQARMRLLDWKRELLAVPLFGVGLLGGALLLWLYRKIP